MCLVIFSMTTMALSTTMPVAMVTDIRETTLIVYPPRKSKRKEMIKEQGMVKATIMPLFIFNKKANTTRITKKMACKRVVFNSFKAVRIYSELSSTILTFTSLGNIFLISFSFFFTLSATSTVFFPVCFCNAITIAGFASPHPIIICSLKASSTWATSFR